MNKCTGTFAVLSHFLLCCAGGCTGPARPSVQYLGRGGADPKVGALLSTMRGYLDGMRGRVDEVPWTASIALAADVVTVSGAEPATDTRCPSRYEIHYSRSTIAAATMATVVLLSPVDTRPEKPMEMFTHLLIWEDGHWSLFWERVDPDRIRFAPDWPAGRRSTPAQPPPAPAARPGGAGG